MKVPDPRHYEKRCPSCNVTYPLEQKRCIHCGARLGGLGALAPGGGLPRSSAEPDPEDFVEAEEADEQPQLRRGMTRGLGLLWIFILLATTIVRACTEH